MGALIQNLLKQVLNVLLSRLIYTEQKQTSNLGLLDLQKKQLQAEA
jgi:hypothetical protein